MTWYKNVITCRGGQLVCHTWQKIKKEVKHKSWWKVSPVLDQKAVLKRKSKWTHFLPTCSWAGRELRRLVSNAAGGRMSRRCLHCHLVSGCVPVEISAALSLVGTTHSVMTTSSSSCLFPWDDSILFQKTIESTLVWFRLRLNDVFAFRSQMFIKCSHSPTHLRLLTHSHSLTHCNYNCGFWCIYNYTLSTFCTSVPPHA